MRLGLVSLSAVCALAFSSFEAVTAFIGAVTALTAFTVPALCYAKICAGRIGGAERVWLGFVSAVGVVGMVTTLVQLAMG